MFDSHAHVMFNSFDSDRPEVIKRAREANLWGWLEVGTELEQSRKAILLAEQEENVWATVGVHPSDISELSEAAWQEIEELLQHEKVKAVGEVGLDFYRMPESLDEVGQQEYMQQQEDALRRFLVLSQELQKPVIFHVRDGKHLNAHDRLIALLQSYNNEERPSGVIHTFSGNQEQAGRYLELGMHLSFSGVVTFKNAGEIAEVAKTMPRERMLIETDCPFLAPDPYRGQRNEPAYVRLVAEKVAALRGVSVEEIEQTTDNNARALLKIGV